MKKLLFFLITLALAPSAYACPMCKDLLKVFGRLTEGWFWSILLMISVPFLMIAFATGIIVKASRRNQR